MIALDAALRRLTGCQLAKGFALDIPWLDRLYQRVVDDLDAIIGALGLKAARHPRQARTKSPSRSL
jgi:hypothetical protein